VLGRRESTQKHDTRGGRLGGLGRAKMAQWTTFGRTFPWTGGVWPSKFYQFTNFSLLLMCCSLLPFPLLFPVYSHNLLQKSWGNVPSKHLYQHVLDGALCVFVRDGAPICVQTCGSFGPGNNVTCRQEIQKRRSRWWWYLFVCLDGKTGWEQERATAQRMKVRQCLERCNMWACVRRFPALYFWSSVSRSSSSLCAWCTGPNASSFVCSGSIWDVEIGTGSIFMPFFTSWTGGLLAGSLECVMKKHAEYK